MRDVAAAWPISLFSSIVVWQRHLEPIFTNLLHSIFWGIRDELRGANWDVLIKRGKGELLTFYDAREEGGLKREREGEIGEVSGI